MSSSKDSSSEAQKDHGAASSADNAAADLIRKKVEAVYAKEPDAAEEAMNAQELGVNTKLSKHQQFIYDLTNSGKSLSDIQAAWHEYYAGLPDPEKHQVWQEFYSAHAKASHYNAATQTLAPSDTTQYTADTTSQAAEHKPQPRPSGPVRRTAADLRDYVFGSVNSSKKLKPMQHLQSLVFGLAVGAVVVLIFLFSFFNERFIAPFIQPSRNVTGMPIIAGSTAGDAPEIIIPKINVEIPVVYDVKTINEAAVEKGLESGVVHYADTAMPGENGNLVIVGHSSNNIFNPGKYKFAFVLLSRIDNGDTFYLQKDGKRYTYQVYKKEIVKPTDVSVLGAQDKTATATLITCDPPGTSTNRLVVVGEQISPSPATNVAQKSDNKLATQSAIIPSDSPSLWSRFIHWFTR